MNLHISFVSTEILDDITLKKKKKKKYSLKLSLVLSFKYDIFTSNCVNNATKSLYLLQNRVKILIFFNLTALHTNSLLTWISWSEVAATFSY